MLGIYGIFSTSVNTEIISFSGLGIHGSEEFHNKCFYGNGYWLGLVYPKFNKERAYSIHGDDWILIDGYIFNTKGNPYKASEVLDLLIQRKAEALFSANGEFFLAAYVSGQLILVNDFMGQRQHCLATGNNSYGLAPSPGKALNLIGLERKINRQALFLFINTRKFRLNKDTIWENCKIIPPAMKLSYEEGKLIYSSYYTFSHKPTLNHASIEELIDIYRKAVNSRIFEDNLGLTLTGGLDSRTMVGAIDNSKLSNIKAITMGQEACEEVLIAGEVAGKLNISHIPYIIRPEEVFEDFPMSYFEDEDIDLIIQGLWNPFAKANSGFNYILHGLDLDVTLGGIYLTDELVKINNNEDFFNYVVKDNLRIAPDKITNLFKKEKIKEIDFNFNSYFETLIDDCKGNNYLETYDKIIMLHSMGRVILQRYRGIRKNVETISPMYDRDLINYILSINIEQRSNYKTFFPFINTLCPELCKITYQRTNLPANVPVEFWKRSQVIESSKEELYRTIAHDTGLCVNYKRYYTNMDEWMRFNARWKNVIFDLLMSERSIIKNEWINYEYLHQIISEHFDHKKAHYGIIQTLMSAEIFLRIERGVPIKI